MSSNTSDPELACAPQGAPTRDQEAQTRLVGDGYDVEPLLTAEQVGEILSVPMKSVYDLPIPRVRIGERRVRWRPADVTRFIQRRVEDPA